ncbi:MAG: hypothetical protein LBR15_03905 [Methanobrevibacter sp.]|jgi:hypothetical protein|nr:hypothetical protein [Candidatus Methanovirga australis]
MAITDRIKKILKPDMLQNLSITDNLWTDYRQQKDYNNLKGFYRLANNSIVKLSYNELIYRMSNYQFKISKSNNINVDKYVELLLNEIDIKNLIINLSNMLLYGYSFNEINYKYLNDKIIISDIIPISLFTIQHQYNGYFKTNSTSSNDNEHITLMNGNKIAINKLVISNLGMKTEYPFGKPLTLNIIKDIELINKMDEFACNLLNSYSYPKFLANLSVSSVNYDNSLKEQLANFMSGKTKMLSLEKDDNVKQVDIKTDARTLELLSHQAIANILNTFGGNELLECKFSSMSQTEQINKDIHNQVDYILNIIAKVINEQIIKRCIDFNFNDVALYPKIHFYKRELKDMKEFIDSINNNHNIDLNAVWYTDLINDYLNMLC